MQPAHHSEEFTMNKLVFSALSIAVLASSNAFAEGKTRAQVYQELIEAKKNGLDYVTDTSYPGVNPIFEQQVARLKQKAMASATHHDQLSANEPSSGSAN
jgi:hypothetical protein